MMRAISESGRAALLTLLGGTLGAALVAGSAQATSFTSLDRLEQLEFRELATSLGTATHYRAVAPAEALGLIGFDVALELSSTPIERDLYEQATQGQYAFDALLLPRVHAHLGLPGGIDAGAFVGAVADTDMTVIGGELRLRLIEGDFATPAVALRASYSEISGVPELELANAAVDLSISKGFLMLTPYAGVGIVRTEARDLAANGLQEETVNQEKFFVGVNVNLGLNFAFEADQTGDTTSYSAKAGLRF